MDRAVRFIDGNNWHYALRAKGVVDRGLDYRKVSRKLIGADRRLVETRYYVGRIKQEQTQKSIDLYRQQRRFLQTLGEQGVTCELGRIEKRNPKNELAGELNSYANRNAALLADEAQQDLRRMAGRYARSVTFVEKAVDVMIAVDMISMAINDQYDAAYLLSADGDYTPVVNFIQGMDKKVYAASTSVGRQLESALAPRRFIRLDAAWFMDCWA